MDVTRPRATKASQITWDLAATLIASLENGGVNEISVAGLSGVLADPHAPAAHKTTHQDGGGDEISVAGLIGVIPDNAEMNSGNYNGNGADNRGIAHGLGRVPKLIIVTSELVEERIAVNTKGDILCIQKEAFTTDLACTIWNSTNFYTEATFDVTGGINNAGGVYYWIAIG